MAKVYGLVDPRDVKIYYIGVTLDGPESRLRKHIKDINTYRACNDKKNKWLMELRSIGLRPTCTVLEVADNSERFFVERRWIRKGLELDWPLTNDKNTAYCKAADKKRTNKKVLPTIEQLRLVTDLLYS